ncbi:MAG TPA: PIG-L family deacetylase [Blastocatellia bacterium]|nr:PIG-L family deacetylase [Blastocatellia bacterium]
MTERRLLAIFAHPDDEAFAVGGTIAKYTQQGVRVELICATSGEAGRTEGLASSPEELGKIRRDECRESCRILGISDVHFLGYRDKELNQADPNEVKGKIVPIIRSFKPDVIVTFGPEGGGNEHPDHKAISALAWESFKALSDPNIFPDSEPHQVAKFYYVTAKVTPWREMTASFLPITATIDIARFVETKLKAFSVQNSQQSLLPKLKDWIEANENNEHFYLAYPEFSDRNRVEMDLFEGVTQDEA